MDTFQGRFFSKGKTLFFVHPFNKNVLSAYPVWHSLLSPSNILSIVLDGLLFSHLILTVIYCLGEEPNSEKKVTFFKIIR